MTNVIGVDPSLTCTGLATTYGCESIKTKPNQFTSLARLQHIAKAVCVATYDAEAGLVVMEGLAFASKSGMAGDRAGLHWLIRHFLDAAGIPVAIVTPSARAKYATGKGNAGKDEVLIAVVQRLPIHVSDNNEADAAVLLAMGLDWLGTPLATMPATHRTALDKVEWPEGVKP